VLSIYCKGDHEYRLRQLDFANRHNLHQLKSVCMSGLCIKLSFLAENIEFFDGNPELLSDYIKEVEKRQVGMKEINVVTETKRIDISSFLTDSIFSINLGLFFPFI
jgi:hypothetical protein